MSFTLRFSGHETFALRYGWLNKSYNSLDYKEKNAPNINQDENQDQFAAMNAYFEAKKTERGR